MCVLNVYRGRGTGRRAGNITKPTQLLLVGGAAMEGCVGGHDRGDQQMVLLDHMWCVGEWGAFCG